MTTKEFGRWSISIHRSYIYNWNIGFDYYEETAYGPEDVIAKICQLGLVFFRITIVRWNTGEYFKND